MHGWRQRTGAAALQALIAGHLSDASLGYRHSVVTDTCPLRPHRLWLFSLMISNSVPSCPDSAILHTCKFSKKMCA